MVIYISTRLSLVLWYFDPVDHGASPLLPCGITASHQWWQGRIGWLNILRVHSSLTSNPEAVVDPLAYQISPLLMCGIIFSFHAPATSFSRFQDIYGFFDLPQWVAQMLLPLIPLFPVSDDEAVVETLFPGAVSPLLVVIER